MFVDETHLNDDRGTKTFVRDITAAAMRQQRQQHHETHPQSHRPRHARNRGSLSGGSTGSVSGMKPLASTASLGDKAGKWRGIVSIDKRGNRTFEDNGAKDLIKLFVNLLDRM